MVVITKTNEAVGSGTRGKVGKPLQYGKKRYGYFEYGQTPPIHGPGQYGYCQYAAGGYGEAWTKWGIYQIRTRSRSQKNIKEAFYIPANPQTEIQQTNRNKWKEAVASWNGLTDIQKEVYNEKAKGKPLTGHNLYVKQYMLS